MPDKPAGVDDERQGSQERESLTGAVVGGLKWSYASTFVTAALQVGVTAVLARLLTPSVFGLVAMASVFLRFGQYFAQMGAGQAVVQRPELTRRDVHTAFTSAALLGVAFTVLFVSVAPLATILFPDTADVVVVTRVMALTFTFGGLTATTQALLRRRFAFRAIALTEITTYVIGYAAVGLVLAAAGAGVWSLVAASLAQAALAAAVYVALCRDELGFALGYGSLKGIYSFGGRVSVIGFLEFVASNLDVLWAGHFLGARATGLYTRATNLGNVPLYYFTSSLSRVLLPAYSRIQADRDRLRRAYLTTIMLVAALAMPVAWGVAGASNAVIATLLGDQWLDAVPVLTILSLAVPLTLLTHFGAILCEATATLNVKILITASRVAWLAALLIGIGRYGVGLAAAFALSEVLTHLAYVVTMRRLLAFRWREYATACWQGVGTGIVVGITLYLLDAGLHSAEVAAAPRLLVTVGAGASLLIVSVLKVRGGQVWLELRSRWRTEA